LRASMAPSSSCQSVVVPPLAEDDARQEDDLLVIATVDNAVYRERLAKTVAHLRERGATKVCPVPLLDASRVHLKKNKVLMAGWREILLPFLLAQQHKRVLVLEDDARLARGCRVPDLFRAARAAFRALPAVDIVSLGHSWHRMATDELREFHLPLAEAPLPSVHATTAVALRASALETVLATFKKAALAHLDHFLFTGSLPLALRDPPLVGWATERVTLTNPLAHGTSLRGGGRKGALPPPATHDGIWLVLRCSDVTSSLVLKRSDVLPPGTRHFRDVPPSTDGDEERRAFAASLPGLTGDRVAMVSDLFQLEGDDDDPED